MQTGDAQREFQGSPERGAEGPAVGGGQRRSYWREEVRGMDKGAGLSQGCLLPSPPCGHNLCYIVELALLEFQLITGILSQNRQEERLPEQAQPFGLHKKRTCYFRGGDLGSRVPATHAPLSPYSEMGCSGVCLPALFPGLP